MRSFSRFSVLDEISCGFAAFSDFLRGFSVSNRPLCPPRERVQKTYPGIQIMTAKTKTIQTL